MVDLIATAAQDVAGGVGPEEGLVEWVVKGAWVIEIKQPAVLAVAHQRARAGGAARQHHRARRPCFEDDQSERFRKRWQDEHLRFLEQPDQARIVGRQSAGQQNALLQSQTIDLLPDDFTVRFIRARAGEDQQCARMFLKNAGRLFHEPGLVLDGINSPDAQHHLLILDLGKGAQCLFAVVFLVNLERHTVRLHDDPFVRIFFLQQTRFTAVARDDRVGFGKQTVRLKEQSKKFSPFPAAGGPVEIAFDLRRQIEHAAVDGHEERHPPHIRRLHRHAAGLELTRHLALGRQLVAGQEPAFDDLLLDAADDGFRHSALAGRGS